MLNTSTSEAGLVPVTMDSMDRTDAEEIADEHLVAVSGGVVQKAS